VTPTLDLTDRLLATVEPELGRIPMFVYTDPDVYARELKEVFGRTWLFVAHESELLEPGNFVVRDMGEQSVIVVRSDDGALRTFLNSCRHRGMKLTTEDFGNATMWRCPYHGYTYANHGVFMGTPFERFAYPNGLDREGLRLAEARTESYQGLVFANWDQDAEPLEEFLGDMKWYLDIFAGRADMVVSHVAQRWVVPSAWKLPSENFASDAYHTATAHSFLAKLNLVSTVDFGRDGYHVSPGNGHGLGIGVHTDEESYFPPELREEYAKRLDGDQLALLDRVKNYHGNVFPNLSFLVPNFIEVDGRRVTGLMLRLWQPAGPDRLRVWSWFLVEANAPDWWRDLGRKMYTQTFGMAGMFDQDDTEVWEAQSRNANTILTRNDDYVLDYSMGMQQEPLTDFPGPGTVYDGKFNEAAARSFYRAWLDRMVGDR
jgi:phenylpropionate dioxygenase-like ring-hydroxylating dioxygenase large terminal subunit